MAIDNNLKVKFNSRWGKNFDKDFDIYARAVVRDEGGGGGGITPAEVDTKIANNNTNYVDVADATLQTNIDAKLDTATYTTDKPTFALKTETDASQTSQNTLIQANTDAIDVLNAPAGNPGAVRTIATDITVNSTNFGKIFFNSGNIAVPTTKTNLNLGTFSGGFYNSSGTVLTITKAGLVSVRFHATLDAGSSTRNVELAIEVSTDGGATWSYSPNSLRLWEQSSVNSDRNAFFDDPVAAGTKFRLAYWASGAGVNFIQPTSVGLTGAIGYTWLIQLEWRQL